MSTDKSKAPQCKDILAYLQRGNRITYIDALNMFGCARLSARIWDLRHSGGYQIVKEMITNDNGKRYAAYHLKEDNECTE